MSKSLKISLKHDLLILDLLVGLLILLVFLFPSSVLRIVLGLPFVLFFPGYVLLAALYPRQGSINGISMTALSFGLSLAVVPLIGLALNYMPWGITLQSILYSEAIYIIAMSVVAWLRRHRLLVPERFRIEFTIDLSGAWGPGVTNKVLSVVLVVAILGVLGTLVYVIARPKTGEKFTEFYILGEGGKAQDYPRELTAGEKVTVTVGIINHEYQTVDYSVEVRVGDILVDQAGPLTLAHEEKWEGNLIFSSLTTGRQKAEFFLYRDNGTEPYMEPLRLWVEVTGESYEIIPP
jgi:uncharacterized membrane protein